MDKNYFKTQKYILLDGGFGTELIKKGLPLGEDTASAVFLHPQWVEEIHRSYVEAGSNIIYADTFGANRFKLRGSARTVEETVNAAVGIAKKAAGGKAAVALDVSSLGVLLEPAGELTFDDAYEAFREVMLCGKAAGADLIALETFTDVREARIALLAAKENTDLPVIVTVSFGNDGLTMNGTTPEAAAMILCAAGADAVGVNCSNGPDALKDVVNAFLKYSTVPVIVKPNAGLPDPDTGKYSMGAAEFADITADYFENGAVILGGCCGTSPEYIKALKEKLGTLTCTAEREIITDAVCGTGAPVLLNEPRIIGERINPTGKKRFKQALTENDIDYVLNEGITQVEHGADILDVNVGLGGIDEKKVMTEVVTTLQSSLGAPLQLDSTKPEVLESALRVYAGKAIVNSVNGEEASLNAVLPLVKKYGAAVICLTLDENGIPETAAERVKIAEKIINRAVSLGIPKYNIIVDCLAMTASAKQDAPQVTLEAMREITAKFGVKTALGVSNVSFGLPARDTVNAAFLTLALENGLTLPIINPNSELMTGAFRAFKVLKNLDKGSVDYINAFSGEKADAAPKAELTICEAVEKGLLTQAAELTKKALCEKSAQELIDDVLIPTLDKVGANFESGKIFLPQLMRSADAAGACFDEVKAYMKAHSTERASSGKILLATVRGDVHDIGKNIVKTVLENYGFEVVDLGKDVPVEEIVKVQREQNIKLVGLSALMTTTLGAMEETVKALHIASPDCKVVVGGAVLTPEYAAKIGADYYSKDAKMNADIAREVFALK